jgi:hypothetical protein
VENTEGGEERRRDQRGDEHDAESIPGRLGRADAVD